MTQLEIEVLYNLQCESAASMFNLRDVVTYIAKRVGLIPGRVWFGAGNTFSVKLTAQQRRNFLRFLSRHELKRFLVFDDFHKRQPARPGEPVGKGENLGLGFAAGLAVDIICQTVTPNS